MKKITLERIVAVAWIALIVGMCALAAFLNQSCAPSAAQLAERDYRTWSENDCLSLMMSNTRHNLKKDGQNVYAIITPFTPEVVKAIGRMRQLKHGYSDSATYDFIQGLTKDGTGAYLDRSGVMWDAQGNRFTGRRDSIMLMVNLTNKTWPCRPPTINGIPLLKMSETPCETPDIQDIEHHIFLLTATGDTLYPKTVWGRKNNILTDDEHLIVVFDLRYTERQDSLSIIIDAFNSQNNRELRYALQ